MADEGMIDQAKPTSRTTAPTHNVGCGGGIPGRHAVITADRHERPRNPEAELSSQSDQSAVAAGTNGPTTPASATDSVLIRCSSVCGKVERNARRLAAGASFWHRSATTH